MRIKDARQTFVGVWIRRLIEGQPFEVWGGSQLRDFNYVDDVVDAFLHAATSTHADGEAFNLGSPEIVSLGELARLLVGINGNGSFEIREFPEERRKIDIGNYYSDYTKARQHLGWEPATALADGLARTLAYFREHSRHYL